MQEALSFGPWLKQRRRFLDLTQEELAQRAACSLSTLRKIEAGDLLPSKELAHLLAVALGVPDEEQEAFIAFARDERRTALTPAFVPLPAASVPQASSSPTPARRHTLPTQLTPLIGRATELTEIQQRLANPTCTLLTIVGPGGIGKTRLALAAAHDLVETNADKPKSKIQNPKFHDGVYFVPFAGVTAPEFMVSTLANAIGFSFANSGEPKEQLLNYLSAKSMLLVLDNLEHLLDGTDLLVEILQAAPRVKLLTTSRERLAVVGEWVFELPTLPAPPPSQEEVVAIASYGSVALFLERAQRTHQHFALSAENGAAVAQICRLVGGMPLGVELAASWVHTLSCAEIAKEIEQSLDFLTVNHRNLPERQRSVRATFDYSWRMLNAAEQQVLRRLSVFRSGFQREAATQVAGATLPGLAGLVSKSLVRRTEEGRYDLHELVRQYAADHLSRDPQEETTTQDGHAAYFLTLLAEREAWLCSNRHQAGRKELLREHENLRVAWEWAGQRRQFNLLRRATFSFWFFHELRCLLHEGEALFRSAAQAVASWQRTAHVEQHIQQVAYAYLLANQAWFAFRTGQAATARLLLQQAIPLLRQQNDPAALVESLWYLSVLSWFEGALQEAEQLADEAIDLSRALGLRWQLSMCINSLGYVAHFQGNYEQAQQFFEESLAIMRSLGDPRTTAVHIVSLCWNNQVLGRFTESKLLLQEALQIALELDDMNTLGLTLQSMSLIAFAEQDMAEAQRLIENALVNFRDQGDTWHITNSLNVLGWIHINKEQPVAAQHAFREAVDIAIKAQLVSNALDALCGLVSAQAKLTPLPLHLTIAHYALLNPASTQKTKDRADALRLHLEATLVPHQTEAARTQAQTTTLESLVAAISQI